MPQWHDDSEVTAYVFDAYELHEVGQVIQRSRPNYKDFTYKITGDASLHIYKCDLPEIYPKRFTSKPMYF